MRGTSPTVRAGPTGSIFWACFIESADQTKTLTSLTSAAVWARKMRQRKQSETPLGRCAGPRKSKRLHHPEDSWAAHKSDAKRFYGYKTEQILSASDSRLTADLKYEDDKHALVGMSRDKRFFVYARLGATATENFPSFIWAPSARPSTTPISAATSARTETGRSPEQNERAENAMPAILR